MEEFSQQTLEDGSCLLSGEQLQVLLEPDVGGKVFYRVGMKMALDAQQTSNSRVGIVELPGGIRLYVSGRVVVVSNRDLNP